MGFAAYYRLLRAGFVLAREGALSLVDPVALPPFARLAVSTGRILERRSVRRTGRVERLRGALNRLGPTYVKFGQVLATRADIVGPEIAADLSRLQDRMEPFPPELVPKILRDALGGRAADLTELSPPIAAASIAQVHKAILVDRKTGRKRLVAVKILRPRVGYRFMADMESFYAGARIAERLPSLRRLRPVDVVSTLDRSARLELDLRLEAAAISEFAGNIADEDGFAVPDVFWDHTAQNVLTTSWVDGISVRDVAAIDAAGLNRSDLARILLQNFLKHAIRDGFFHADMHPGNLFADPVTGEILAVDFGIMGRLARRERRFLADIIYGFITRNYRLVAERHFDIGYVPKTESVDDFALALRSIGEPLQGRTARDISMAKVLGQLFATTELFQMQTRPELILLQKNMVLVEGTARSLDPELDIWTLAEPIVGPWVRQQAGPLGVIEDGREQIALIQEALGRVPRVLADAEAALQDYHRDRAIRRPAISRAMLLVLYWLLVLAALAVLVRSF